MQTANGNMPCSMPAQIVDSLMGTWFARNASAHSCNVIVGGVTISSPLYFRNSLNISLYLFHSCFKILATLSVGLLVTLLCIGKVGFQGIQFCLRTVRIMGHLLWDSSYTVRLASSNAVKSASVTRYDFPILMAASFLFRIQSQTVSVLTPYLSATCSQVYKFVMISPPLVGYKKMWTRFQDTASLPTPLSFTCVYFGFVIFLAY